MQNFDEVVDVMPRIERCAAYFDFLMVDRRFAEPFCGSFFFLGWDAGRLRGGDWKMEAKKFSSRYCCS